MPRRLGGFRANLRDYHLIGFRVEEALVNSGRPLLVVVRLECTVDTVNCLQEAFATGLIRWVIVVDLQRGLDPSLDEDDCADKGGIGHRQREDSCTTTRMGHGNALFDTELLDYTSDISGVLVWGVSAHWGI